MRVIFLFILLTGFTFRCNSQSPDYKILFGENWNKALKWEEENKKWIQPLLAKYNISYPLAISIVFPELVRYSALQDKMEISLLKTLYVNLGDEYANFSIGVFQMKPSFAGLIREKATMLPKSKDGFAFKNKADFSDIIEFRKAIIKDLEDPKSEIMYLVAFIKICERDFSAFTGTEDSRIKFLATAYNYGIDKSESEIKGMIEKKFFSITILKKDIYSYADVSLFWYSQFFSP